MSAGVPHDTLTDAVEVGKWLGATNAPVAVIDAQERVAAELARVSREHETMRNALQTAADLCARGPACGAVMREALLTIREKATNPLPESERLDAIFAIARDALAAGSRVEDNQ